MRPWWNILPAARKFDLMEAAYMMMINNVRRLVVEVAGKVAGVIREQDLFFEMERILREK